jgi:hypothetical protein
MILIKLRYQRYSFLPQYPLLQNIWQVPYLAFFRRSLKASFKAALRVKPEQAPGFMPGGRGVDFQRPIG